MGSTLGSTFAPRKFSIKSELDNRDTIIAQMTNMRGSWSVLAPKSFALTVVL